MCGFVLSLSVLVAAVHVPIDEPLSTIGWYIDRSDERVTIHHIEKSRHSQDTEALVTGLNDDGKIDDAHANEEPRVDEPTSAAVSGGTAGEPRRVLGRKILDVAQEMPQIVGGIGAYYIHIEYPESAIQEGVEGRLVLSFIVDTDGETNDIEVIQPLHPDCDSAAVRALRRTIFVPGNQNGEPVQVRMRLPVRFQLLPHPASRRAAAQNRDA